MGSTLVYTGEKVDNDTNKIVFVIGSYRLGPVYINREIVTTAMHPGEGYTFATGAGGEDTFLIHPDKSPDVAGIIELDKGMIATCASDYATGDDVPGIQFHLNFGAILRNVQCADPATNLDAWTAMTSSSGTAGAFMDVVELAMETGSKTGGYQFQVNTLGTNAAAGTFNLSRVYLRQMYYLADPGAAYTDVMAITLS